MPFGSRAAKGPVEIGMKRNPHDVSIDLTLELRWFFDGRLPPEVRSWFTSGGVGLTERRCDTYRLDGSDDTGVKRRSQRTLELKRRTLPPEAASIAHDAHGRIETWRRWSPADEVLVPTHNAVWGDIDKTIIKRRFGTDGHEIPLSEQSRAMTGDGCDAEIVALSANGQDSWSFAFAAFGRADTQRRSLEAAWASLGERRTPPAQLQLVTGRSYGYPEWLTQVFALSSVDAGDARPIV